MRAKSLSAAGLFLTGLAVSVPGLVSSGLAQTVAAPPPSAAKATGVKSFETGAKAFEAGRYGPAVQSLSAALQAGGLSSQQMAKALYYRGAAYRKEGKTAQAISDLTSAVWLKNGLNDSDRAAAMEQRQQAYREAGLGDGVPIGAAPLDAPAGSLGDAAPVQVAAAPPVRAATETASSSWAVSTSDKAAAEASIPAMPGSVALSSASPASPAAAPSIFGGLSPVPADAPSLSALPQGNAATEAAPSAELPSLGGVGSAIGNAGSAVGNFFGNLFTGAGAAGAQATSEASSSVATASTGSAAGDAVSASGDWGSATRVVEGKAQGGVRTAATDPSVALAQPVAAKAGRYRLQVGVVRSRAEAEQMAAALRQKHGAKLGTAAPAIDEVVYGNMGTFYRVQVGPYAGAAEPGKFCDSLKPQGYDCLVVTQ